jgi:hypothetical protein
MDVDKKPWWRSKTLWFNVLVAIGTAVEAYISVLQYNFDPRVYLMIVGAVAGVNVVLRFISTQGLTK